MSSVMIDDINDLLVDDPQDQGAIADAIARLLADTELRRRLGQAGFEMAREKFSWERVATAFEDVMAEVVNFRCTDSQKRTTVERYD